MYSIHFTEPAEEDLSSTIRYIAEVVKSPSAAKQLLLEIEQQVKILEDMPFCCSLVFDEYLASKGVRSLVVKNYQVFYIIKEHESEVSIIRILYARRDWSYLLRAKSSEE